MYTFWINL